MVKFARRKGTTGSGCFWTDHGFVYDAIGRDGKAFASLYGVELGNDGCWVHLAIHGKPSPLESAAAMREGMRLLLEKFPMMLCQTDTSSRMHRLLLALGFRETGRYLDTGCQADMTLLWQTSDACPILNPLPFSEKCDS